MKRQPTKETYAELDRAYEYFNNTLFGGKLPPCVIVMQRRRGNFGYFWGDTWSDALGKVITDEIALNPDYFKDQPVKEVLSTLVHEMCHLRQHHEGKPSRNGYHNREWAWMMKEVGLIPSNTGKEGGRETGQRMADYIEPDGAFDLACEALLAQGFTIPWVARTKKDEETRKKKKASKTRYTCSKCGLNAWAKPEASLICGECEIQLGCA